MSVEKIPQQTLTRIKQIRALALFGKKKHYNAADRKQRYHDRLGVAVITINVVLGSGLVAMLGAQTADAVKWSGAALSLVAALCAAYQKFFGLQQAITGHRRVAGCYLELADEAQNLLASFCDGMVSDVQLGKSRDALQKKLTRLNTEAHSFSTSLSDYAQAQQGMANGEETYTEAELKFGENP